MKKSATIIILALIFIISGITAFNDELKIREYTEKTTKVTDNFRLLLITDLHSTIYGKNQKELVENIDKINPDVILFGGDILDDVRDDNGSIPLFEAIGSKYLCYYVSGNHEYWSGKIKEKKSLISSYGITILEGDSEHININNQNILLCGIDDPECESEKYNDITESWYSQLETCNLSATKNQYSILLSHRPEKTEDYKKCSFDLILSGHAHGGQVRIPFILNGLFAPNQGYFPKYAGGRYNLGNCNMIVSRGLMITNIPRIFNPPELVVVNIKPE